MTLLEIARQNEAKNKYFSLDYEDLLRATGHEIVKSKMFGYYQGDYVFVLRKDGKLGVAVVGYGSCSGCDALQAAEPYDISANDEEATRQLGDVQALADQIAAGVVWPAEGKTLAEAVEEKIQADQWWAYDKEIVDCVRSAASRDSQQTGDPS